MECIMCCSKPCICEPREEDIRPALSVVLKFEATPGGLSYTSEGNRFLGTKQAELVVKKINEMLLKEFPNGIPYDAG